MTWLSDHRLVFGSTAGGDSLLWTVSSRGGSIRPLVGIDRNATQPSAGGNGGNKLLYAISLHDASIWQALRRRGKTPSFQAHAKLIAASGINDSAQYSPDGSRIVFVSNRSGSFEIWTVNRDGSDATRLTHADGVPVGSPHWSPDGKQIVYDSVKDGFSAVFLMNADGTKPRVFASGRQEYMMPTWSRDGSAIYFTVRNAFTSGGTEAIWRKRLDTGEMVKLAPGRGDVLESLDRKSLYFSPAGGQLETLQMPAAGGKAVQIPELKGVNASRYRSIDKDGLYFLADLSSPWNIDYFDSASRRRFPKVAFLSNVPEFGTPSLALSPDGQSMLFTQVDQSGSDLMLMENPR